MILQSELPDLLSINWSIRTEGGCYRPGLIYKWDDGSEARVYDSTKYPRSSETWLRRRSWEGASDHARRWMAREREKYGLDE